LTAVFSKLYQLITADRYFNALMLFGLDTERLTSVEQLAY